MSDVRPVTAVVADLEQVGKDIADLVAQTKVIHDAMVAKQEVQAALEAEYQQAKADFESAFLANKDFMQRFVDVVKGLV